MKRKILVFIILIIMAGLGYSAWMIFGSRVKTPQNKYFFIHTGTTRQEIGKSLSDSNIISGKFWFEKVSAILKFKNVKPGRYEITQDISLYRLVKMLRGGQQVPLNLVITKLRLKEDLARLCGQRFEFDSVRMIRFISDNDSLKEFDLDTTTFMSAVLPNTYTLYWNSSVITVVQKLVNESNRFWNEERKKKCEEAGLTPLKVSTLASIIDEETNYAPEKPLIASVYINRLRKGIPLQADPTIKFALKDFAIKRIYEKHLQIASPYNTYSQAGLPPGPICTPQLATLDAVLDAPQTDYLYFVAKSDFSGQHDFSATFDEHIKKANEYRNELNRQQSIRNSLRQNVPAN